MMTLALVQEGLRLFLQGELEDKAGLRDWAERHDAVPAWADMGGVYAIRTDGAVISATWDEPEALRVEENPRIRNTALFMASELSPALSGLRPERPANGEDCSHCHGTGEIVLGPGQPDNIVCYCGGLGWVPSEDA